MIFFCVDPQPPFGRKASLKRSAETRKMNNFLNVHPLSMVTAKSKSFCYFIFPCSSLCLFRAARLQISICTHTTPWAWASLNLSFSVSCKRAFLFFPKEKKKNCTFFATLKVLERKWKRNKFS